MAEKIAVLLVDDHALVRRGFRRLLEDESDIVVQGEASDGEEAVQLAKTLASRCGRHGLCIAGSQRADRDPAHPRRK